jgi:pimeloyl-ACP methyl ester carboxylesterase
MAQCIRVKQSHNFNMKTLPQTIVRRCRFVAQTFAGAILIFFGFGAATGVAQDTERGFVPLPDPERTELKAGVDKLAGEIAALKQQYAGQPLSDRVADVEIYLDAVKYAMEDAGSPNPYDRKGDDFNPFANPNVEQARAALRTGKERASELAQGRAPWMEVSSVRGYYSKIDGSAQPYQLTLPIGYDAATKKGYRLDIFEHGRGQTSTELPFLNGKFMEANAFSQRPFAPDATRFVLQPFGRWCNATRFAGEIDTLEAIASVKKSYPIDNNRMVMTGFSMGGASAWLFATHEPDLWAASSAGAGFSETTEFLHLGRAGNPMPPAWQQTLWHMYDAVDYAGNLFNQHMIAYAGTKDGQRQASEAMKAAMAAEVIEMERVDGVDVGHTYEPGARLKLMARLDELAKQGRDPAPKEIHFTTWMLRYNKMFWLTVEGMEKEWSRARADGRVDGNRITLTTSNISALRLNWTAGLTPFEAGAKPVLAIDGMELALPAVSANKELAASIVKHNGKWKLGAVPRGLRKKPGLQGPIDDAFMDSFMIVRPTGAAFNEAVGRWTVAEADRAIHDWRESFRGEAKVKKDADITDADIAENNLILFGDPSSNLILKKIASRLPIQWTAREVTVGDKSYPAAANAPIFIFPNPLNPKKYIVCNSGFTFHDLDNNDKMNPKLPDWAVVDVTRRGDINLPTAAVGPVGFFDENWKLQGAANN